MTDRPEVEMSDISNEVQTPVTVTVADLVNSIENGDALSSAKQFDALVLGKIDDALEAEKVKIAGNIFNGEDEEISDEEIEAEIESELNELEREFGEDDTEVEEPEIEPQHDEPEDSLGLYGDEIEEILSDEEEVEQ